MMLVEKQFSYTPQVLADLDALMHELSATSFCNEELLNNVSNVTQISQRPQIISFSNTDYTNLHG